MAYERKEHHGEKLKSIGNEEKRTVYVFTDATGREIKISAFPPLPDIKAGRFYDYTEELVPTKEQGKFYHNLARSGKDQPHLIREAEGILPAPEGKPEPKPVQPSAEYLEKQRKYEEREARREARIVRGNSVNAAAEVTAALIAKGVVEIKGETQAIDALKLMARQIEDYILEAAPPEKKEG
jgi:hypothetical protein